MSQEPWELDDNPSKYHDYNWYSDEVPTRKFYLFIAEIGHRLRRLMTDEDSIKMIELCEQCGEGVIEEDEVADFAQNNRPTGEGDLAVNLHANALYYWVGDRYKVASHGVQEFAIDAFMIDSAVRAGVLRPDATNEEVSATQQLPEFAAIRERTELEWGELVRCIYGANPFHPVVFDPRWRSESAVVLARTAYDTRDFTLLPILADALEEAGCDHADVLAHCRDPKASHARGCWVVDLVLNKS